MKTVCVYHSIDIDGWMSAAIVRCWYIKKYNNVPSVLEINEEDEIVSTDGINEGESLYFIGYNYGQPIPDLSGYDKVIMCDISFPKEMMEMLYQKLGKNFIWIDHHSSAIKDYDSLGISFPSGLQDTNFAACELTWKYFFTDEQMPEIVRLLGMYDSFRHKGTDEEQKVLEFQYGARQCISNYGDAYDYLLMCRTDSMITEMNIWKEGSAIYSYLCTEAKQVYKNGFPINFYVWTDNPNITKNEEMTSDGKGQQYHSTYKFICINKERFNPINFGIDYHEEGYDGAACFYFDGTTYNFSVYNDNGKVDCSIIAKQFGGGGHKGASGFRLTPEQFNRLIK